MVETASQMMALGTIAPDFTLRDMKDGNLIHLQQYKSDKATVIMFLCNHCPYVKHIHKKLLEVIKTYQSRGIQFIGICSNDADRYPQDSPQAMHKQAQDFNYSFPYLYDETQEVAKSYQAACTPDFYIFDKNLQCVYRGRFDDATPGNASPVTGADLCKALDCILINQPLSDSFNEAFDMPPGPIVSDQSKLHITLPPYTALSGYWSFDPNWAFMGTVIYTQWSSVRSLILRNVAGIELIPTEFGPIPGPSRNITVVVPQSYNNTWSVSLGANYSINEKAFLRTGIGFDQSPVRNYYRNVQLPDGNRFVIALGGHYQATRSFGMDLGWTHLFMRQVHIYPPVQDVGIEHVTTRGKVNGGADVFGAQITWDMV